MKLHSVIRILPAVWALMALCTGCEQESPLDVPASTAETTTLTLHIGTQSPSASVTTKADDSNVLPYEGLRTVRVIITYDSNRRIGYNVKHTVDDSQVPTNAVLNTTLTLQDVPVGNANIYVIANEESLGMEYNNATLLANVENNKLEVVDKDWSHFPKTYAEIAAHGLPMSAKLENQTISADMSGITIRLDRAVVKLHLTVENATGGDLTLKWVKFGKFVSDRFYMFREQNLDIPTDTQYKELQYGDDNSPMDVTLAPNGARTSWNPVYIYPNFAYKDPTGSNPYTLTLNTGVKEYGPSSLGRNLNSLVRNTQFNILARITATATVTISYEYVPWEKVEIDVPSFD